MEHTHIHVTETSNHQEHSKRGGGREDDRRRSGKANGYTKEDARARASSRAGPARQDEENRQDTSGNFKRLVVCCDGTWLDSDSGLQNGKLVPPSNITRLTRAVKSESDDGIQQIVYYQAGVGSMGTVGNRIVGGISGEGLAEHVREAYSFIANNYDDGDEVFLLGFSRGAYTARAVGGLVDQIGVLTKAGLSSWPIIYKDFAHRHDRRYRSPQPNVPFANKPRAGDPRYVEELERRRLTTVGVKIKAIGVFDTVGSLGIPQLGLFGRAISNPLSKDMSEYRFYDTALGNCIENAFQALALDERRAAFQPTLWEKRGDNTTNLIQVWFPGVHANVGGGYPDQELSNITLAWMMAMLSPLLDLNLDYIITQERENGDFYEDRGERVRPWSFGKIVDSASGLFALGGKVIRTPGNYTRMNPQTGEATNRPLRQTNEFIHPSVRSRFKLGGPGYADKGEYDPKALRPWRLRYEQGIEGLPTPWFWEDQERILLPEPPLRKVELMLLKSSPDIREFVLDGGPKPKRRDDERRRDGDDEKRRDGDDERRRSKRSSYRPMPP